jgi:SAM-dependent methyltransferase
MAIKRKVAKIYLFFNRYPRIQAFFYFFYKIFRAWTQKRKFGLTRGKCGICGKKSLFFYFSYNRESVRCVKCGANARQRFTGVILKKTLEYRATFGEISDFGKYQQYLRQSLKSLEKSENQGLKHSTSIMNRLNITIYEPDTRGAIHHSIASSKKYIFSEYFPDQELGKQFQNIRNEDLQNLSFKPNSIDYIVTQDVFEHIYDPFRAFQEIFRVLKPYGMHIFTVPLNLKRKTQVLVDKDGKVIVFPKRYHSDIIDTERSLVVTNWGLDIVDYLKKIGFETVLINTFNRQYLFLSDAITIITWKK